MPAVGKQASNVLSEKKNQGDQRHRESDFDSYGSQEFCMKQSSSLYTTTVPVIRKMLWSRKP